MMIKWELIRARLGITVGTVLLASSCGNLSRQSSETTSQYFVPASVASKIPAGFSIVSSHDSGFVVEGPTSQASAVRNLSDQSFEFSAEAWQQEKSAYTFPTMEKKVQELAKQYPRYAKLSTYATSTQGRPQYVLTLTDSNSQTPKKELMITAATHGNEIVTVDTILGLTELLLKGQGTDQRLTNMLEEHTIHIIPAVCVDSYVARTREAEGLDPNRDYAYPNDPNHKSVKCISDIKEFFNAHDIVATLDYHSAASMVFFPWAYTYDHIPQVDFNRLDALTTKMASHNGFEHGQISSTIYVAKGSSADYYYWKHHTVATAIELSHNLAVNTKSGDDLVTEVTESTWTFIEDSHW